MSAKYILFLYSPSKEATKPAWSVHGMKSEDILLTLHKRIENYIFFDRVDVNIGSMYNITSKEVVINEGGVYYVANAITGNNFNVSVSLILNDEAISFIKRPVPRSRGISLVTRERAVLLNLHKDDKLAVKITAGIVYLSLTNSLCSFTGFMIYAV